jgi:histidyl-tRNA synthetase
MLSRVYSFLDWDGWSGERVVLRPDGTIPAARLYIENLGHLPLARLFYIQNMFAFEGTGEETRERWQCGAELIGGAKPAGDIELILLALEVLSELGIEPIEVRLSHAGLLRGLLSGLDLSPEEQAQFLEQILVQDARVISELKSRSPELEKTLNLLFELKGSSRGLVNNIKGILTAFPAAMPAIGDLAQITDMLSIMGYNYSIDFASTRGFEYYTGAIFQFYSSGWRIGSGGRYDELIPLLGGGNVPACGFALYLDELMNLIKPELKATKERIVIKAGRDTVIELKGCCEIAQLLRERGYIAEIGLGQALEGVRWIISVETRGDELVFRLSDQGGREIYRGTSSTDALQRLEEARWQ